MFGAVPGAGTQNLYTEEVQKGKPVWQDDVALSFSWTARPCFLILSVIWGGGVSGS